jgi:hypothetical protein
MAHSLIAQAGGSLLVRTISVTVVVMAFFGVATGALPVRCWIGGICATSGEPATLDLDPAAAKPAPAAPSAPTAKPRQVAAAALQTVARGLPTLTHNDVIASTFSQLKVEFQAPTALPNSPVKVATASPAPLAAPAPLKPQPEAGDGGLTKRIVTTIGIRPDGTPDLGGSVAEAYAAASPLRSVAPSPALAAAARIGAGDMPVAEVPAVDLEPKTPAAPPPKSDLATVLGQGANVRSTPSKGGKVLFALNGGEKVTVLENRHGWTHIRDDHGRTGWIYADGLHRT